MNATYMSRRPAVMMRPTALATAGNNANRMTTCTSGGTRPSATHGPSPNSTPMDTKAAPTSTTVERGVVRASARR